MDRALASLSLPSNGSGSSLPPRVSYSPYSFLFCSSDARIGFRAKTRRFFRGGRFFLFFLIRRIDRIYSRVEFFFSFPFFLFCLVASCYLFSRTRFCRISFSNLEGIGELMERGFATGISYY